MAVRAPFCARNGWWGERGRCNFLRMEQHACDTDLIMSSVTAPVEFADPINAGILAVSEDRIQGFQRDPLGEISRLSGIPLATVIERIAAMLRAGTIRRVRQTLL